jgi:hypothetical protein
MRIRKKIARERARREFEKRTERAKDLDKQNIAKDTREEPDEEWVENQNRIDVEGIDAPPYFDEDTLSARDKGMQLMDKLLELDPATNLTSSTLREDIPELHYLTRKLRQGDILLTMEDVEKLEERFEDQYKLREIRTIVEGIEEVNELKRRKRMMEGDVSEGKGGKQIEVDKFNRETYQILRNALGEGESISSDDIVDAPIANMSKITGPDPTYGLSRSWLGYSEYGEETEYEPEELDRLEEGAIIERNTSNRREYFRKIDNEWHKIGKKEGSSYTLKGVVPEVVVNEGDKRQMEAVINNSDDLSARMLAVNHIDNIDLLEDIAVSDESYRMRSRAYHRIKELNPDSPKLKKLREYYDKASKMQKKRRKESKDARSDLSTKIMYFNPSTLPKMKKKINKVSETSDIEFLLRRLGNAGDVDKKYKERLGKQLLNNIPRSIDEEAILDRIKQRDMHYYKLLTS